MAPSAFWAGMAPPASLLPPSSKQNIKILDRFYRNLKVYGMEQVRNLIEVDIKGTIGKRSSGDFE